MRFVEAVDGGNTKTIALVVAENGKILGWGRAGPSDIYGIDSEMAANHVATAMAQAEEMANVGPETLASVCLSMAGADWPEDFAFWSERLSSRYAKIDVVNDAIGALYAGRFDGYGVSVVWGTGLAVGAQSANGFWHASFWVSAKADYLYREAMRYVLQSGLECRDASSLTGQVLQRYGMTTVEEWLHAMTRRSHPVRPRHNDIAGLVLTAASGGDPLAQTLVDLECQEIVQLITIALKRVNWNEPTVPMVIAGGFLRHPCSQILTNTLLQTLQREGLCVCAKVNRLEPVAGAAILALRKAGILPSEEVVNQLIMSMPPSELFETLSS
ncbi:MAG: hypothetical protein OWU33_00990 [Firmicutes bacterium]|nr:hypothetical protein [Bacillota bacterium]